MGAIEKKDNTIILHALITPKASRDSIIKFTEDELKITITAPPVDGKANQYLIKYLAKQFGTAKSRVKIVKGESNHHKKIEITGVTKIPAEVDSI